jgi:anti-sigma regulatory factor (Ser/Thr protein kinase)
MKRAAPILLEVRATPEEVMRAVEALQEFGHVNGLDDKVLFGLALSLEECASNIVNHSLRGDSHQTFLVSVEQTANAVTIELRDRGPEFDPTQHHASKSPAGQGNEAPAGGWGILLVRRYMDEIRYKREDGENVLRLTKHLRNPSAKE